MFHNYLLEDKEFAVKNCKLFYQEIDKPCTETCMCFGWECGDGWNRALRNLSTKIEMLNMLFYPKYGVKAVADQIKEKFGTLRVYYTVSIESPLIYRMWHIPFEKLYYWMRNNIGYSFETIVDSEGYESEDIEEIPLDSIEQEKKDCEGISNVRIVEKDGKFFKVTKYWVCRKTHQSPTKNKFLFHIQNVLWKISLKLDFRKEPNSKQLVIQDAMDKIVSKYISEAEQECYNTCEDCGTQIGTEWSPRITTKGWISYVCKTCEIKRNIRNSLLSLKYSLDHNEVTMTSEETSKMHKIEELMNSEEHVKYDEYKNALDEIREICKK